MATVRTAGAGDISAAATWTGGALPAATDAAVLDHACTLANTKTFTAASLDLLGSGGGGLTTTGTGTITAAVSNIDRLIDTASTALVIVGNCTTAADTFWESTGVTTIRGTLTCGGTGATYGLKVTATSLLTVTGGVTAVADAAGVGIIISSGGALVADAKITVGAAGKGIVFDGGGLLTGAVDLTCGVGSTAVEGSPTNGTIRLLLGCNGANIIPHQWPEPLIC